MPYSKQHKQETRERILEAAAAALREAGMHGVGIGELMARAGLTHGGFYAHFPTKDVLVAQACIHGMEEASEQLLPLPTGDDADREVLRGFIRAYLSRSHRDHPTTGCMLPPLAADVARAPDEVRSAFTDGLKSYIDQLARLLAAGSTWDASNPEDDALVVLSGLAGAMLLARAVNDPQLSDRILAVARDHYDASFVAESVDSTRMTRSQTSAEARE